MLITQTRVYLRNNDVKLKAFVSFVLDNQFVIHNAKIIEGKLGLILCMPSRKTLDPKTKEEVYRDVAHPITKEFRTQLEKAAMDAYRDEAAKISAIASAPMAATVPAAAKV